MQRTETSTGAANIRAHEDATQEEVYASYTEDQQIDVDHMKANAQIYRDLTKSIAPQVYGHEDVKRAVLLMLFGGVHKTTKEASSFVLIALCQKWTLPFPFATNLGHTCSKLFI